MEYLSSENKTVKIIHYALAIIIILYCVFLLSYTPVWIDNDVWWHLKTGKYIIEHNYRLPKYDVFAWTSEKIEWDNHEWLSQIIFYKFYQLGESTIIGGMRCLTTFKTIINSTTFLLLFLLIIRRNKCITLATVLTVMAIFGSRTLLYARPPVFTFLFLVIFLHFIYRYRYENLHFKWLIILPFLMILWVNLHGGFMMGIILVGAFLAGEIILLIIIKLKMKQVIFYDNVRKERIIVLAILLLSLVLASLINPYGYRLYLLPLRVMKDPYLVEHNAELVPPPFWGTKTYYFLVVLTILSFIASKFKIKSIGELLMVAFLMQQSLSHSRHMSLFSLISTPFIAENLSRDAMLCVSTLKTIRDKKGYILQSLFAVIIFIITMINERYNIIRYSYFNSDLIKGIGYYKGDFPSEACDFIILNDFEGRMYNNINIAGYLIWRLSPEYHKVFTDSRFDIFSGLFLEDALLVEYGVDEPQYPDKTWYKILDKWKINFIVVPKSVGLNKVITKDWILVYYNQPDPNRKLSGFNIYVKDKPENKDFIERCKKSFENLRKMYQ
jgi:hypothetical protein